MKIVTWNVNSIKMRTDNVIRWIGEHAPDVLMIQELKGTEFPHDIFKCAGYETIAETQKAYNGVAILSRHPFNIILNALPGDQTDEQARYLEADISGLRVINIYLPNGNPVGTDKFEYKLKWMERLYKRIETLRAAQTPFLIGGDFNVIPEPRDCHDPKAWADDALFRIETRRAFRKILNLGLTDAFRIFNQSAGQYSFWDYQAGAWEKNNGIRIDHFLLSPEIADRAQSCAIDSTPRGWDKPSDHVPVVLEILG
jgi:exodeoxyribonuclease-3